MAGEVQQRQVTGPALDEEVLQLLGGCRGREVVADLYRETAQLRPAKCVGQGVSIRGRRRQTLKIRMVVLVDGEDESHPLLFGHPSPPEHLKWCSTNMLRELFTQLTGLSN